MATTTASPKASSPEVQRIVDAIRARQRFVLSSHSRPDGDSIGSQLAMLYALRAIGKEAIAVNADPAPPPLMAFPGVSDIVIAPRVEEGYQPTGFSNVQPAKTVRPLSGRFPTKRRTGLASGERVAIVSPPMPSTDDRSTP